MYLLYSAALAVAAALAFPYYLIQGLRHGKYLRNFWARWGRLPADLAGDGLEGCVWLHAVSVGEVLACPRLVSELRTRLPTRKLLVSTTTETGMATARARLAADGFFYCPFDFAFVVRRVLRQIRPALVVVAETELWPNLFQEVRASGARLAVVNARISDRSFPRYRAFRFLFEHVLGCADRLLAQSAEDARRLREMGARPQTLTVTGTLKYDLRPPADLPSWLDAELQRWAAPGVLLAGSTAAGEEEHVLAALARLRRRRPALRLLLAPRRPERFDEVATLVEKSELTVQRRSRLSPEQSGLPADVLLLDTVGELAAAYRYADVAFVGGSLVPHGGQNPLEPALFARPIIVGPHTSNFREITETFRQSKALRQIQSAGELGPALEELFSDPVEARQMGERARALIDANRGATEKTAAELEALLGVPRPQEVGAQ